MTATGALILFSSLFLIGYWFRYTCTLILRAHANEAAAVEQARANHLSFPVIREKLRSRTQDLPLSSLHQSLERDYRFVRFLLRHARRSGAEAVEMRLLALDYRLMQCWYALTRYTYRPQAYKALEEMSRIVGYLAQKIGAGSGSFQEA
jgi:hypothetical protein